MTRWIITSFAATAAILLFGPRHGTLHELRAANNALRGKISSSSDLPTPTPVQPPEADQLNPEQHAELLRLRGQIQPLQQEIQELSNRVGRATGIAAAQARLQIAETNAQARALSLQQKARKQAEEMQALFRTEPIHTLKRNADLLGQKLQEYTRQNGQLPQDLSQLDAVSDGFELIRTGSIPEVERALVIRQKEPVSMPDGKSSRIYIRADGSPVLATLGPNADWTGWEQRAPARFLRPPIANSEEGKP